MYRAPCFYRMMRLLLFAALALIVQIVHSPQADAADSHRPYDSVHVGGFSESLFAFVTIINYDGKSLAGGWQEAVATLRFVDARHFIPQTWTCNVKVGMPIKPEKYGVISATAAASMSAGAATLASVSVMKSRPEWIAALYCGDFKTAMERTLNTTYKDLGARVSVVAP